MNLKPNGYDRHNDGETHLHKAASSGDIKKAEELLALGADVNAKDNYGRTPLHAAATSPALR